MKIRRRLGQALSTAVLLWLLAACSVSVTGTGIPDGSPPPKPKCNSWAATDNYGARHNFTLRDDGYVDYTTKNNSESGYRSYRGRDQNARWNLAGTTLTITLNSGYAEYTASVVGDQLVNGTAHNQVGFKWTWSATRNQSDDCSNFAA